MASSDKELHDPHLRTARARFRDPARGVDQQLNLRICMYFDCVNGTTEVGCKTGTSSAVSPNGLPGCCSDAGTIDPEVSLNCAGTIQDDADSFIRIDGPQLAPVSCVPYRMSFDY